MNKKRKNNGQAQTRLQTLLLQDFLKLAQGGKLSPTDRRTLYQMLKDGGWSLDPTRLPSDLHSKLRASVQDDGTPPRYMRWEEGDEYDV